LGGANTRVRRDGETRRAHPPLSTNQGCPSA